MYRFNDRVRRRRQETINQVRTGDRFGFRSPITPELGPYSREGAQRTIFILCEPYDIFRPGLRVRLRRVLRKAVEGNETPVVGLNQARQCRAWVLRMLVTGKPPARGGGGIPQRIITNSRSVPALRTTGAG